MELVAIIILLAIMQFIVFAAMVGWTRPRYGINAPKTVGNEDWERRFRVHQNTMEQLVSFIPAVWLCGTYVHIYLAAGLGLVYLIGRTVYAIAYLKDPDSRTPGTLITFIPIVILVLSSLIGIVLNLA